MSDQVKISVDDLIQFLENERDLYGSFSTTLPSGESYDENSSLLPADDPDQESTVENVAKPEPKSLQQKLDDCSTLEELLQLCEQSDELKTDLEGTNLVFGVGNPTADLMLIGEAPGEQEDIQGEPFVGAAGQLLNKILSAIQFERDDIYIANILKHRPPGNRNPTPEECAASMPFLKRQIELIQPKLILCLGKISATTLLERDDTLSNLRGSFYPYLGTELTVTYHPAALLRNPKWKRPVWEDVQALRKRYDELDGKP